MIVFFFLLKLLEEMVYEIIKKKSKKTRKKIKYIRKCHAAYTYTKSSQILQIFTIFQSTLHSKYTIKHFCSFTNILLYILPLHEIFSYN